MDRPFVVLAIDALEYELVERFGCKNLKQENYNKTDISEFSQPRTMVLWSSFLTGENKEADILAKGDKEMWNTKIETKDTFLSGFSNPKVIDLPGYSYDKKQHDEERRLLKAFFDTDDPEKKDKIMKEYNKKSFDHHKQVKDEFMKSLEGCHDLVIGYFSMADVVGHLNFGNTAMMRMIYEELDELAGKLRSMGFSLLILSDHGMMSVGKFGDHSNYGFWSTNFDVENRNYRITDFGTIITNNK
ncbi:MAG: hypothetical protein DRO99_00645 [Candidatus Aenigmatarchaeota archaeon]|nr:MAG: hypothetical protein DRO99_00645 [Candidatus Aenigmarchaeota archaeon]